MLGFTLFPSHSVTFFFFGSN